MLSIKPILFLVLLAIVLPNVLAMYAPPAYEHKARHDKGPMMCETCQAVIKEVNKRIKPFADGSQSRLRQKREAYVYDVLESICQNNVFLRYEYSPPNMIRTCGEFMGDHQDQLVKEFWDGPVVDAELRQRLCIDQFKYCDKLWNAEEEELRRERTPDELEADRQKGMEAHHAEEAKKKKEERLKRKAEKEKKKKAAEAATAAATETTEAQVKTEEVQQVQSEPVPVAEPAVEKDEL